MAKIKVLDKEAIEKLITVEDAVSAVEKAYIQYAEGSASLWPVITEEFASHNADMDIKSGCMEKEGVFGLKLVSWFGDNASLGLPQLYGTTLLFDSATGSPLALVNANALTGMRTGAAGAIGVKYCAADSPETLLMVGAGGQSPYLIASALFVKPSICRVIVADPFSPEFAKQRLPEITQKVAQLLGACTHRTDADRIIETTDDLENAVRSSQVIMTATPSRRPMIKDEWVRPGTHFSCIGSDMSGKEEIDPNIFKRARVFADDVTQAVSIGECEIPAELGMLDKSAITFIGDIVKRNAKGRGADSQITIFDSTGIALQDLAAAKLALDRANKLGLGQICDF